MSTLAPAPACAFCNYTCTDLYNQPDVCTPALIGIVVGGILFIFLLACCCACLCCSCKSPMMKRAPTPVYRYETADDDRGPHYAYGSDDD